MRIGLLYETPNDDDHESSKGLQQILARNFASFLCQIAVLTNSINHSLFLWELEEHWSYIFSWSWKSFTETDTDVSAAQASAVGSWENSSEHTQFLVKFDSAEAEPQRNFPFFCWDRAAPGGQTRGREDLKFEKAPRKRNVDKDV